MTISATGIFKKVYTGSGTSTFAYDWKIDDEDELLVQQLTIATGVTTTLTITTDYTVTGVGVSGGGNVVLTVGSFPSGLSSAYKLIITSNVDTTQTTDYVENDPFPAETHEAALDKLTKIAKQLQEQIDRSLLQAVDQTSAITFPSPSADKVIGWNSGATALENKTPGDLSSAFDITLGGSDATKPVIVNATGDGYEISSSALAALAFLATVGSSQIDDAAVTLAKMANLDNLRVIGRVSGATGVPEAVEILDEDTMSSNSATKLATQQSIKAYIDARETIKGWVNFTGTGTIAITDSFNVSGLVDNGTGDYTVTWDTDFASVNYAVAISFVASDYSLYALTSIAAGTVRFLTGTWDGGGATTAPAVDASIVTVMAAGDQ